MYVVRDSKIVLHEPNHLFEIFQVPDTFTTAEIFDLFWKVHKVFNLDFDPNLKPMMKFIQHFIFCIETKRCNVTPRMKDLFNGLSNPSEQ